MLRSLAFVCCLSALAADAALDADYVIENATLYDGSGGPGIRSDLAFKGDRIVAVGRFSGKAKTRIDAEGLIVAPGFIDLHTHSDKQIVEPATRSNLNYLTQGVATIVTGNCGFGPVDVADFYKKIDKDKAGSNVAHQVPHNDLRRQVMGNANRAPKPDELEKMKKLVDAGMKAGAWGLSTGLYYTPGSYADISEIVELTKIVARHRGFYASHIRNESVGLLIALDEAITIGERCGVPVHISHLKASGKKTWGKSAEAIALIQQARMRGLTVTADQYPYIASSTSLAADVIPAVYREGSQEDLAARLTDKDLGPKIRQAIETRLQETDGGQRLRIARYAKRPDWQGKDLLAVAQMEKRPAVDIVVEIQQNKDAQIVHFSMQDEDVRLFMKQPFVATASDGSARTIDDTVPHPRNYGCFSRKVGLYAIADKIVSLEQAIRSASGLPADVLHLPKRGYLKPGFFADVLVFDPKTFRDTSTFDKPHQYSTGVRFLFVNGTPTIKDGKYTHALAGRALRHSARP